MNRERPLKVVLVVVGLIFSGLLYPLTMFVRQEPALAMMLSLYVTLGIFLLIAVRNPAANRSLIAFTAWSSFAHAALMGMQAFGNLIPPGELWGVAALVIIGVAGISTPGPIVSWLFRDIRNPGNGLHILQNKFHGHQQTERCSMIHGKGLTVEVCGEQRLGMAGRRQVERHKIRIRIS